MGGFWLCDKFLIRAAIRNTSLAAAKRILGFMDRELAMETRVPISDLL
jgi:hypothetical protein